MSAAKRLWLVGLALAAGLLLAACGANTAALQPGEANTEPAANNMDADTPAEDDGQLEVNADGTLAMPELGFDHGAPALKATDPTQFERATGQPQIVELFAFWWGTCQRMAPVVHGLENKYGEHMNFVFLDIDDPDTEPLQEELGFSRSWRPYIFFLNSEGEIIGETIIGQAPGETVEQAIIDVLVEDGVVKE